MLRAFTISITLIIVSVLEGLPLAVSLAMTFSVDYMKKDNLLVKKMASVEGLGTVENICTGKTATLTENNMHVSSYFVGGTTYKFDKMNSVGIDTLSDLSLQAHSRPPNAPLFTGAKTSTAVEPTLQTTMDASSRETYSSYSSLQR